MEELITGDIFVARPTAQTLVAWNPFWDCVDILFHFQNSDVTDGDEELTEWRLYWVAGIALLRTIGHVLVKVDSKTSQHHARAIDDLWQQFKSDRESNRIFWKFIEKERNNILKTYSFGARLSNDDHDGYYVATEEGEDAFQKFREAVYWWRHQLTSIENKLHK